MRRFCRYVPGPVLRAGENELVLLEVESAPKDVKGENSCTCCDQPTGILCTYCPFDYQPRHSSAISAASFKHSAVLLPVKAHAGMQVSRSHKQEF